MYILVCDITQGKNALPRINYWLQSIVSASSDSPITIICSLFNSYLYLGTHMDVNNTKTFETFKHMLDEELDFKFKNTITAILSVSNETGKGFPAFHKHIQKVMYMAIVTLIIDFHLSTEII